MGGGHKKFSRISREQILNAYRAGPDAIVSLIDYLQETLLGIIEEHEARIEELEAKLNKDSHNGNKNLSWRIGWGTETLADPLVQRGQ